ncbi:MAG: putative bifunctional diguanylate cyclase/phosphodiesterase [Synechococcus sp.]
MSSESGIVLELRRSLARREMALAEIHEGLAITDAAGQLLWCNAAFERLIGRARLLMLGQPLVTLLQDALGADPRLRLDRLLAEQAGGGMVTTVLTREPLQVVDIRWRPVRQEQLAPYVFTFHDVSDRVSLEELRRRSQDLMDQQLALAQQVQTCPVTGLPNRRGLSVAIQDALESLEHHSGWMAVLFCDLNRFKEVNDTYGHRVGDQLLIELAQRMKQVLRPKDVLARLGGDEFVMLCTDLGSPEDALQIAERLQHGVGQPWMPAQADTPFTIVPQVSVGISLASGGGMSADRLLHDADLAMYEAKRRVGRQIVVFDAQIAERLQRRLEIRRGLEEALRRQILPMHFQPVVSLESGLVVGYEALARPRDRQGGPIPPIEFIQVAESSGLIQPLGQLVVEQGLRSARDCGLLERGLGLAVNFAAPQLASRFLSEDLIAAARRYGCPPHLFTVEVTETVLIDQPERIRNELTALRAAGFRVMLDDFGVGYSSLTWLAELPIDGLKIDRSFTATMLEDRRRHALIAAVLQLARELELEVVAEGIETAAQEKDLLRMGCGLGQGNRFSKPLHPSELLAGLAA